MISIPAPPELIDQNTINLIKKPVLVIEQVGIVLACNLRYLDFRNISTFNLIGHGAYDHLSAIQCDFYKLAEKYLLSGSVESFEYEGYKEANPLQISLQRVQFSIKKIDAIKLTITFKAAPHTIVDRTIHLTARETSVLQLLIEGHSQKEIARSLFLSHHTVAGYLKIVYSKLGVKSSSQALLVATTNLNMRARVPLTTHWRLDPQ